LKGKIRKFESGLESNKREWRDFDERIKKVDDKRIMKKN
jgi:hypothetical protein